jgi:hypothetical protein
MGGRVEAQHNTECIVSHIVGPTQSIEFGGTPLEAVIRATAQDRFAVYHQIREKVVRVLTVRKEQRPPDLPVLGKSYPG